MIDASKGRRKRRINQPRGPWHTETRQTLHENKFGLVVVRDNVLVPSGKPGIYDYIHASPGAYVVPVDEHGTVYLIGHFRYPAELDSIEAVSGGRKHKNETYLNVGKSELRQELGIRARDWVVLKTLTQPAPHVMGSPQKLFLARDLTLNGQTELDPEEKGGIRPVTMPLEEAVRAVEDPDNNLITETPSQLAIFLAYKYLNNVA